MNRLWIIIAVSELLVGATACSSNGDRDDCISHHELHCFDGDVFWFDSCGKKEEIKDLCAQGCPDGECTGSCTPQAEKRCVDGDSYWFDSCGAQGDLFEDCQDAGCTTGACAGSCTAHAEKRCVDGDSYWFDSCGTQEDLFEDCQDAGCTGGVCDTSCTAHAEKRCVDGDVYWFDSCDAQEELFEDCQESGCTDGVCGECVSQDSQHCFMGDLYWFDSCGNMEIEAEECEVGCLNDECQAVGDDCVTEVEQHCHDDDLYYYDSCGNLGDLAVDCDSGCRDDACFQLAEISDQLLFRGIWTTATSHVDENLDLDYRIVSWFFDGEKYVVLMRKDAFDGLQFYSKGSREKVRTFIQDQWDEGDDITEWSYVSKESKEYIVVMTSGTGYTSQKWSLNGNWDDDIAFITDTDNANMQLIQWFQAEGGYLAVLAGGEGLGASRHEYGTWADMEAATGFTQWWADGYRITCMSYSDIAEDKAYLVGLHADSTYVDQEIFRGNWDDLLIQMETWQTANRVVTELFVDEYVDEVTYVAVGSTLAP